MANVFIGGIPASGKSYLAKKLATQIGVYHLNVDTLRDEMSKDPELEKWVNFYWNQDEEKYLKETPIEEQKQNLIKQSEAFWPFILKKLEDLKETHKSIVIEAVNILPHLAARDLNFSGVYLLGSSFEEIFERNKANPRWGSTEDLQRLEAESFFNFEREFYKNEAEKYGFKTFTSSEEAEKELLSLLSK